MDKIEKLKVVTHNLVSNNVKSFISIDFIGEETKVLLQESKDLKKFGTEVQKEVLGEEYTFRNRYFTVYRGIKFFAYSEEEIDV